MGFFDWLKRSKTNAHINSQFDEILIPLNDHEQAPYISINNEDTIILGASAVYKNGILVKTPSGNPKLSLYENRKSAYTAQFLISDGIKYDFSDEESIKKIHIPQFENINGMPNTAFDLAYMLKTRAIKEERPWLAVPLVYKTANMMLASPIAWQKKDYYRLIIQLWSIGEIFFADYLLDELKKRLPIEFSDDNIKIGNMDYFDKQINMAKYFNSDYIEIPYESSVCEKCAPYHNRVYSISGNDARFPKLPDSIIENKGLHCLVNFHPFTYYHGVKITKYKYTDTGEMKEIEVDAISHSNRPFVDDRSKYEKENYTLWEEKNEKRLKHDQEYYDRNNWIEKFENRLEFYQISNLLGDKAPKSLDGYTKMKRNNTPNFQKLVNLAKEKGIQISVKI